MTKRTKAIAAIAAALVVLLTIVALLVPKNRYAVEIGRQIKVENGEADPAFAQTRVVVSRGGTYTIHVDWWPEELPGFLTGFRLLDGEGKTIYAVTGGRVKSDSLPIKVPAGEYVLRFDCLPDDVSYRAFVNDYIGDLSDEKPVELYRDGSWEMDFSFQMVRTLGRAGTLAVLVCGCLTGLLLVALAVLLSKKSANTAPEYDERQKTIRGKASWYAFLTMMAYYLLWMFLCLADVPIPAEVPVLILLGLLLAAAVMARILIMNDAYFQIDQNKVVFSLAIAAFTVLNLAVGVLHILRGEFAPEGVLLLSGSANLTGGVLGLYLLAVLAEKRIRDREEA